MEGLGRGRALEFENPLTLHLVQWFLDLNDGRKFTVIVGPAGGGSFPEALSSLEIISWSALTGNRISSWEAEMLREMDRAWRLGYSSKKGGGPSAPDLQHQGLGEYCQGEKVDECRRSFGSQLEKICATCPN